MLTGAGAKKMLEIIKDSQAQIPGCPTQPVTGAGCRNDACPTRPVTGAGAKASKMLTKFTKMLKMLKAQPVTGACAGAKKMLEMFKWQKSKMLKML